MLLESLSEVHQQYCPSSYLPILDIFHFFLIRKFLGIFFIDVKVYITIEMVDKTTTKMNTRPKRLVSKK